MSNQPRRGRIIVVSGPSGVGKSTLLGRLRTQCRVPLEFSVSATTRPARPGERDGFDYHFISREEFQRRRQTDQFLECCEVFGRGDWYGTPRAEVEPKVNDGAWVVLEIDVDGAEQVLARHPDATTVFILPESVDDLRRRLQQRGTETPEAAQRRIAVAEHELARADRFQFHVVNRDLDAAAERLCEILESLESEA